jgi:hypothetical protein
MATVECFEKSLPRASVRDGGLTFGAETFTPLESPSIYAGYVRNRKHQFLIEGRVKALPFLTGFNRSFRGFQDYCGVLFISFISMS